MTGTVVMCRDMPLRDSPDLILQKFEEDFGVTLSHSSQNVDQYVDGGLVRSKSTGRPNITGKEQERLQQFLDRWFFPPGSDTTAVQLTGEPSVTTNDEIRDAEKLNGKLTHRGLMGSMTKLCRKACPLGEEENSSLIHAPYPFIIPGERFRESYYWDSYWIIKGLLKNQSTYSFCLGIVRNFGYMVQRLGMVPNGFRSYYLNRSQPPMLSCMVYEIYKHSESKKDLVEEFLPVMKQEMLFWRDCKRTIHLNNDTIVSRYYSEWTKPRPESLREDLSTFELFKLGLEWSKIQDKKRKSLENKFFRNISAAAESGWDFSSRWLDESNSLESIRTTRILPVDLNAILIKSERIISTLATEVGDTHTSAQFDAFYRERRQSFVSLFWDPVMCKWRDILLNDDCSEIIGFSREEDYASDWVPLWCLEEEEDLQMHEQAIKSLRNSKINASGGVSASSIFTGQQWDWPNVWPPSQYFLAEGCWSVARLVQSCGREEHDSQQLALDAEMLGDGIKTRYLASAAHVWEQKQTLPEKFDCEHQGGFGYGGEYECVEGFGWSTGLALHWLDY